MAQPESDMFAILHGKAQLVLLDWPTFNEDLKRDKLRYQSRDKPDTDQLTLVIRPFKERC